MTRTTDGARIGRGEGTAPEKRAYVQRMFSAMAPRYDLTNHAVSLGLHLGWKQAAVRLLAPAPGSRCLDVCCGSGDLAALAARRVGPRGRVVGVDFSGTMVEVARERMARAGLGGVTALVQGDGQALPFPDGAFDAVTVGFGIRNLTDPLQGLREWRRVLRPGGRVAVLEFSRPAPGLVRALYAVYSATVVPVLGTVVSRHPDACRYLTASIREWPDQEAFATLLREAGFRDVWYRNLSFGIVAVHVGVA